jgi:hypothetical protein
MRTPAFIMATTLVACAMLLTACAGAPRVDPSYQAYLEATQRSAQQEQLSRTAVADAATACAGDSTCVVAVAGFAALAVQSGGQRGASVQPYTRQPSAWERFGVAALQTLPGLGQVFAAVRAGDNNVAIARIGAEREAAVTNAWSATTTGVASAFAGLPPSISVGGDYVPGSQHIGDAIGGDRIDGSQHIGDAVGGDRIGRDAIGGDAIGGDRIDGSNVGDGNRIGSPGPWDNSGQCTGTACQGLPPTEPDPEPEG